MDAVVRERSLSVSDTFEMYAIGEHLRSEMSINGLIKDRKYHFRSYKTCFQGNETVDWLVRCHHCDHRRGAVTAMRMLQDRGFLHHVCDDHRFKDEALFYRFRIEEKTNMEEYTDLQNFYEGNKYYKILMSSKKGAIRSYHLRGQVYHNAFMGAAFVDLLLNTGEVATKEEAVKIGRNLLENCIIRHITDEYHFRNDDMLLYQFTVNYDCKSSLSEVLKYNLGLDRRDSADSRKDSADSRTSGSEHVFERPHGNRNVMAAHAILLPDGLGDTSHHVIDRNLSDKSGSFDSSMSDGENHQPRSVLLRRVTPDELEAPDTPYVKTCHRVFDDPVGYGFVVRGEGPAYIQTIDPSGPAAAAGLKVRQYVYSVNGENVLRRDHRSVARLIMRSSPYVNICVMTHKRDAD
ncbi:hypothetical protein FSP39_001915 [Pinctada imbricata]|uniref:DEP domain-containing protein n=1 Tax=Pinctada imbricata TaxID=66713 RepID=A0AA88XRN3_PINIB|nr:hypothetical protein FSP39_001915 [Pinctada imbricata]